MAGSNQPLSDMEERFASVRGRTEDRKWFARAVLAFIDDHVDVHHVRLAFDGVPEALAESDEAIAELFGDPQEWVDEQVRQWRAMGIDAFQSQVLPVRDLVLGGFASASVLSVISCIEGSDRFPVAIAAMPLLISWIIVGCLGIYQRVIRTRPMTAAVLSCAVLVTIGACATAGYAWLIQQIPMAQVAMWLIMLPAAVLYAFATWIIGRLWPPESEVSGLSADDLFADDEAWLSDLAGALRSRGDISTRRVRQICTDARQYAAQSESKLVDEFGPAEVYAQRFPRSSHKELRYVWLYGAIVLVDIAYVTAIWLRYMGHGAFSNSFNVALLAANIASLVSAIVQWRRQRSQQRQKDHN
ncbi:MAG: hypothetical protein LKF49_05355 [Bifidobacterium tibiigranuli]|jgi:hypothetical protein|uniref:hypothetical protein n=1 Tax=Bifidobacterium tibiigranuli TaxID=2172043 RepID=UPI0023566FDF|nr:hypothetical protein [Bifidobacterium tibiigranuli]MCH3974652.1 hypothetical protein [Bifidobacterium tibiigranuli]MCH4189623.1 hypothetical protein [Bifidobacterium tibiigranuli]MCH4203620.1 hypothetical protein [Bifidobacterium tibiigranuli]MCH4274173.1 hypothetical protein [Bifidobacterium tibiigranuli]MCI1790887.1 hypothetical protein [Bifidobacterium tibiigranuli]